MAEQFRTAPGISARDLSKTYKVGFAAKRQVVALEGLTLDVAPQQVYGLLGPNGAGKSTTIKLVLDLIRPTRGEVKIFGLSPGSAEARKQVGFLPENPAPYEYLTGREFVTLAGQLAGMKRDALLRRVKDVIEQVGMGFAQDLQIRRYSKGMIQRISLAQAMVHEPSLLILDEPTSGLDVLGRQMIRDIVEMERKRGTTIIFSSHIIPDVEALCDRVAVLVGGKLIREGNVAELLAGEHGETEVMIEALDEAALGAVREKLRSVEHRSQRLVIRCEERNVGALLSVVVAHNGRVVNLQRLRYSLEDLFLQTVRQSGQPVGGLVS